MESLFAGSPLLGALWVVLALLILGYMAGAWVNRRRSKTTGLWLQGGLQVLGSAATWRWIKSPTSGAQAAIAAPTRPFRRLTVSYVLLTRELPPLWLVERLRDKSDLLIVRGELREPPRDEVECVPLHGDLRRTLDRHAGDRPWCWEEGPNSIGIATLDGTTPSTLPAVQRFLATYGGAVLRLSLRPRRPHLVLFMRLDRLPQVEAATLFRAIRTLPGRE